MCVISIKVPIRKKTGNLFNDPRIIESVISVGLSHIYIYIYIYCHPQTDCFVLSELFSVARHAGRSKPGSKPVQLYVRLSFRPLVTGVCMYTSLSLSLIYIFEREVYIHTPVTRGLKNMLIYTNSYDESIWYTSIFITLGRNKNPKKLIHFYLHYINDHLKFK